MKKQERLSKDFNLKSYHAGFVFAGFSGGASVMNGAAAYMQADLPSTLHFIEGSVICGAISVGAVFLSNTARKITL